MPEKHHPTPEERDERISVPLDPEEFIEGVLAVDPPHDYDVYNSTTKQNRMVHGSLADAHRAVNELVEPGQQWAVIQLPEGGTGAGKRVSEGIGPTR